MSQKDFHTAISTRDYSKTVLDIGEKPVTDTVIHRTDYGTGHSLGHLLGERLHCSCTNGTETTCQEISQKTAAMPVMTVMAAAADLASSEGNACCVWLVRG